MILKDKQWIRTMTVTAKSTTVPFMMTIMKSFRFEAEAVCRMIRMEDITDRKIIKKENIENLQKDLDRLGEGAVENAMKINPSKSKAVRFTRARLKDPLDYSLANTLIPEASSCKYLRIILRSNLSWADQVNYTVKKAWRALHFTMRILKRGNSNTKS